MDGAGEAKRPPVLRPGDGARPGLGVVALVLVQVLAPAIVIAMNLTGLAAIGGAVPADRATVTPLLACTTVGNACLRGAGDTRTGMKVMVLMNAVNAGLTWLLVLRLGPVPPGGVGRNCHGHGMGEGLGGPGDAGRLPAAGRGCGSDRRTVTPSWERSSRLLRISLPAAGESLTNVLCQLWFLRLINRLGPVATAAHGVAIRCEAIAFLSITAFSVVRQHAHWPVSGRSPARPGREVGPDLLGAWRALALVHGPDVLHSGPGHVSALPGRTPERRSGRGRAGAAYRRPGDARPGHDQRAQWKPQRRRRHALAVAVHPDGVLAGPHTAHLSLDRTWWRRADGAWGSEVPGSRCSSTSRSARFSSRGDS